MPPHPIPLRHDARTPRSALPALLHVALAAAGVLGASSTTAGTLSLSAVSAGNYQSNGSHFGGTYETDGGVFATENRGYVIFDTRLVRGRTVNGALLEVDSGGVRSAPTIDFYAVTTPASTLTSGGGTSAYGDLGTGARYASRVISSSDTAYSVNLGAQGNSDVRTSASGDGRFAVGMALQNPSGYSVAEAFAGSGPSSSTLSVFTSDPVWSATSANFGRVLVGTQKSANYTISNTGPVGTFLAGNLGAVISGGITAGATPNLVVNSTATFAANFAPTARGSVNVNQVATVNTGASGNETRFIAMSGQGVAPVQQTTAHPASQPGGGLLAARVGTSITVGSATIRNVGDGNTSGAGTASNLNGRVQVSGQAGSHFTGGGNFSLADNASQTYGVTYHANSRGMETGQVRIDYDNGSSDGRNQAGSSSVLFQGLGIGPVFSAEAMSLAFGSIEAGQAGVVGTRVGNVTTDPYDLTLTGMTLLGGVFSGAWANLFSLEEFDLGAVLGGGQWSDLDFRFSPTTDLAAGLYEADFTLFTDVGAALGSLGQRYTFHLAGTVLDATAPAGHVPEPGSLALLLGGLGLLGVNARRRPTV